jgi:hypothetical protein
MVNKEGILLTSVIVFFSILYVVQLIAIGHFVFGNKKQKSVN